MSKKPAAAESTAIEDSLAPFPGAMVNYVLPDDGSVADHARGTIRPAVLIGMTNDLLQASYPAKDEVAQLQVYLDGTNDLPFRDAKNFTSVAQRSWRSSVKHDQVDKKPGTWHWAEAEA